MTINIANLLVSLEIMWKGMAGLFMVCIFVALLTMLVSRLLSLLARRKKNDN